eukprot:SM000018S03619  [mRNA]  locus=s18:296361:299706:+ [translate_table: standard]
MSGLPPASERAIGVVDLAESDDAVAAAVRKAGFFYVVNHGVDAALAAAALAGARAFFALPLGAKMAVAQDANNRGYTAFREEVLDPARQTIGDTKEGFYIGKEVPAGDARSAKPLNGPNQWPAAQLLPGWRETMEAYFEQANWTIRIFTACLQAPGSAPVEALARALDLDMGHFLQPGMFDDPMLFLRLLHYSEEQSRPEEGVFGAGAHTDYGMLTLLLTDDVSGLQICKEKAEVPQLWEDVKPLPGALIVNLGDMLERWTNNRFRSTLHRVVNPGKERYSIPFFFEPNFDCLVECLPSCCNPSNPPRYPPIRSGQYLLDRYKATHTGYDAPV